MTAWRGRVRYGPTLVLGLLAGLGITLGSGRAWVSATGDSPSLPAVTVSVAGSDLAPEVGALGLAVLAAFGAVVATRGLVRRVIGAAIAATGVAIAVRTATLGDPTGLLAERLADRGWTGEFFTVHQVAARWVVCAAAVLATLAGAAVAYAGGTWPSLGSRYDRPRPVAPTTEADLWRALDAGGDPTEDSSAGRSE